MKLGQKPEDFYGMAKENADKMIYPEVSLPSSMFDGSYKVGDKCVLQFTGTIENMGKDNYRVKLLDGSELDKPVSTAESLLTKAK